MSAVESAQSLNDLEIHQNKASNSGQEVSSAFKTRPERYTQPNPYRPAISAEVTHPKLQRTLSHPPSMEPPLSSTLSKPAVATSATASIRRSIPPPVNSYLVFPPSAQIQTGQPLPPPPAEMEPVREEDDMEDSSSTTGTQSVADDVSQGDPELDADIEDNTPKKIWAITICDYDVDTDEDLAFTKDEYIEIISKDDGGWWKGRNRAGKEGVFPHNFVSITENPPPLPILAKVEEPAVEEQAAPAHSKLMSLTRRKNSSRKLSSPKEVLSSSFPTSPTPPNPSNFTNPNSGLPSTRKNSDSTKANKTERLRAITINNTPIQQPAHPNFPLRTSPSMPYLPVTSSPAPAPPPPNPIPPSGLSKSGNRSDPNVPVTTKSGRSPSDSAVASSTSTMTTSTVTPQDQPLPTPPAPAATTPATPLSPSTNSGTTPQPFLMMNIFIPGSGSSKIKINTNQTIADLIAAVAKKRSYATKDCAFRLVTATATDPPIDPSTIMSSIGTTELRLYVEGEQAPAPPQDNRLSGSHAIPAAVATGAPPSSPGTTSGRTLKEGSLMKADGNKKMKKVWVTLDKNFLYIYKTSQEKNPTERISLYCATPKGDARKKHTFDLLTVTNTYNFSAESEAEAAQWINAMMEACQSLILKQIIGVKSPDPVPSPPIDKAAQKAQEQQSRELVLQIRDLPENKACSECNAPDPDWAAINLGVFFCIDCSGIHRSLGVHISQVRSVLLDFWDPSQILTMESIGNKRANDYWEHHVPPNHHKPNPKSSSEERETWIRNKYEQRQFCDPKSQPPGSAPPPTQPVQTPPPSTTTTQSNSPQLQAHSTPPIPAQHIPPRSDTPTQEEQAPVKVPGLDFVGYGFFSFNDDPARPILRRQRGLFKNSFDENKTAHVAINNGPHGLRRRGVGLIVPDHFSVDTSVLGYVPATTKVFDTKDEFAKFLASHTQPQLDSYRQTVPMHRDVINNTHTNSDNKWWAVTEVFVQLYELFVNQVDEDGLSPHVVNAAPLLAKGDANMLGQFIKKNGTHFVRSAVYGGRLLMKTEVDKAAVPGKEQVAQLCTTNFKHVFALDAGMLDPPGSEDLRAVQNYTLDVTGGDNRKRGLDWIDSVWDKPQVLAYELESISAVFDDLSLSVKVEAAINEHIDRVKG